MKNIAVYCGSSFGEDKRFTDITIELGKWMVRNNFGLVYGGGKAGLMGVIADTVLANGGEATGIIPTFLIERENIYKGLTKEEIVDDMATRKRRMLQLSDICIALPGGPGTIEEISEAYSWLRVGETNNPCFIYNFDGFYDSLEEIYDNMVEKGFLPLEEREKLHFITDFNEILDILNK